MRFPRISRLRWDKPPREADRLETLEKMLESIETGRTSHLIAQGKVRA
jgi:DNA ligase-1